MSGQTREQKAAVTSPRGGRLAGADFITGVLLALFGIAFFISAWNMKVYQTFFISPGFFPMMLGILFVFFGIFLACTSARRGGYEQSRRFLSPGGLRKNAASPVFKKGGVIFLLILGYVALLGKVGFVYLSVGYLILTFFFLKAAKWYWSAVIAVVAPIVIQFVFVRLFKIPMP